MQITFQSILVAELWHSAKINTDNRMPASNDEWKKAADFFERQLHNGFTLSPTALIVSPRAE